MKNRIYFLSIALLYVATSWAQDVAISSKTPEQLGGVYYAYPAKDVGGLKHEVGGEWQTPINYIPFYISHYGRHGSRWLPDDARYVWVNERFEDVENLTKREKATYLTNKTAAYTKQMMERWDKLFRLIAVKHNDQIVKPSENGVVIQGQRATPGYDQMFRDAISKGTGDRYVMPENAQDIKSL